MLSTKELERSKLHSKAKINDVDRTDLRRLILLEMRIKLKQGWIQHMSACNEEGQYRSPSSDSACMWCLTGAYSASVSMLFVLYPDTMHGYEKTVSEADSLTHFFNIIPDKYIALPPWYNVSNVASAWNDMLGRKQEDVIALVDKVYREITHG